MIHYLHYLMSRRGVRKISMTSEFAHNHTVSSLYCGIDAYTYFAGRSVMSRDDSIEKEFHL